MLLKAPKNSSGFFYELETEDKEILYYLEQKLTFFSETYQVFDKGHNCISEIKKNKKTKTYELIENKNIVDEIKISPDKLKYTLNNQWTVEVIEKDKKYIMYDVFHRDIAHIDFILYEELWTIDIIEPENMKLIMMILVVIMATNEISMSL